MKFFKAIGGEDVTNIPTMLTINETAERIGLAQHFIRQLCLQNKICYIKAGNKYIINWERFLEYLNIGETESPAPISSGIRDLSKC